MSDDTKNDIHEKIAESAAFEQKKKEIQAKELLVKERRLNSDIEKITKNERDLEIAKNTNYGALSPEQIKALQNETEEYIKAARNCMEFINPSFNGIIPYFRKNLILIGGKTGEGKSTTVANIIASTIRRVNKETGKHRKVLVLTNEEKSEDVYNRVTCLSQGMHYVNHDKFTDEQIEIFKKYQGLLAKDGLLTVVDDSYGSTPQASVSGVTTSIEGIQTVFENLIRDGIFYDVIIIDYYQNVKFSKKNPHMNEYEVQAQLAAILDRYKNIYPAPIVLLAQVSPPDKDNKTPFKTRIEGRKVILNVCTACIEMVADKENLRTEWYTHKSRFSESVGNKFHTGYDKGRFVPYTTEFQARINNMKEKRAALEQDKLIGIPLIKEPEASKEDDNE